MGDDEESELSCDSDASSEYSDDEDNVPREDEFYRIDQHGNRENGQYDTEGQFMVDINDRDVHGRCDRAGFLLDAQGMRV